MTEKVGTSNVCDDQPGEMLTQSVAEERGANLCNIERCAAGHYAGPDAEGEAALTASTAHLHHILAWQRREKDAGRICGLSSAAAIEQRLFSAVRL